MFVGFNSIHNFRGKHKQIAVSKLLKSLVWLLNNLAKQPMWSIQLFSFSPETELWNSAAGLKK